VKKIENTLNITDEVFVTSLLSLISKQLQKQKLQKPEKAKKGS